MKKYSDRDIHRRKAFKKEPIVKPIVDSDRDSF